MCRQAVLLCLPGNSPVTGHMTEFDKIAVNSFAQALDTEPVQAAYRQSLAAAHMCPFERN